jgi:hypothetical protein
MVQLFIPFIGWCTTMPLRMSPTRVRYLVMSKMLTTYQKLMMGPLN